MFVTNIFELELVPSLSKQSTKLCKTVFHFSLTFTTLRDFLDFFKWLKSLTILLICLENLIFHFIKAMTQCNNRDMGVNLKVQELTEK